MFPTVNDPSAAGAMVSSSFPDADAYGNGDSDDLDFPVDPNPSPVFSSPPAAPAAASATHWESSKPPTSSPRRGGRTGEFPADAAAETLALPPALMPVMTEDAMPSFPQTAPMDGGVGMAGISMDPAAGLLGVLSAAAAAVTGGSTAENLILSVLSKMAHMMLSISGSASTAPLGLEPLPAIADLAMQMRRIGLPQDQARAALDELNYDDFSKVVAVGTYTWLSWSDLPIDILLTILQYLDVPQRVAFASVCSTWRSASAASGVPSGVPWFMSWTDLPEERKKMHGHALTCSFYHLLDVNKAYAVSFPRCFVACCGASHGWLIMVNELSNLVLYNPFTMATIDLPPVTDFSCVEAVYGDSGALEHYIFVKRRVHETNYLGTWFYQKAVLSCSPSKTGDYVVMVIHGDSDWLSFVKAGQSKWQVASTLPNNERDRYADCVYHYGRFYSITFYGMVEEWDLGEPNGPTRKIVVASGHIGRTLSRHLVSTTWGDLLRVRAVYAQGYPDNVRFQIGRVDSDGWKRVTYRDLMDHTLFLGLNHSSCLPTRSVPGLLPRRIYFSSPWTANTFDWICKIRRGRGWGGVRTYDLKTKRFDRVFPLCDRKEWITPREVWIMPNL